MIKIEYNVKIDTTNAAGGANADLETFLKFISDEIRVLMNKDSVLDLNFEQYLNPDHLNEFSHPNGGYFKLSNLKN